MNLLILCGVVVASFTIGYLYGVFITITTLERKRADRQLKELLKEAKEINKYQQN